MIKKSKISAKDNNTDKPQQYGYMGRKKSNYGYDASNDFMEEQVDVLDNESSSRETTLDFNFTTATDPVEKTAIDKEAEQKQFTSEADYQSFMASELAVATDQHDVKAKQDSDGKHVLEPEEKEKPKEDKNKIALRVKSGKKDRDKELKKEASGKLKDKKEKLSNTIFTVEGKEEKKEDLPVSEKGNGTDAPTLADSPTIDSSALIIEQNLQPASEAELQTFESQGEDASIQADTLKQAFLAKTSAVRASIQEKLTSNKTNLLTSFETQKQKIITQAVTQKSNLKTKISTAKKQTETAYESMLAKLREKLTTDILKTTTIKQDRIISLAALIQQKKTDFAAYIKEKEGEPESFARKEGERIKSELSSAAALCITQSNQVASRYKKDEPKQAAKKVGQESAADIRAKINPMQQDLLQLAKELKGNYSEYKIKVDEELNRSEAELRSMIESLADETIQSLNSGFEKVIESLNSGKAKDLESLNQLESSSLSTIETLKNSTLAGLDKNFHQNNEALDQLSDKLQSGIEGLEGNTLSALEGPGQVYLPGVKTLLNEAELLAQNIDFKGTTLLDQQAIIATEGMTRTAEDFSIHTANQVNSVSESIAKFKDQQKIKLEKIFTEYTKNADKGIKDFESHSQNSIDEGLKEIDGSIQKVKEKIEEQNKEAKEKIALRTDENIEKAKAPLYDDNASRSDQAAAEANKDSWWDYVKGALAAIATIAIMFVVIIVVAAVIVGALAAIGLTVGLWTVVAVIGVGFILYMGYQSYQKRSKQMEEGQLSGWGVAGMVISDVIGITDIYEGAKNKDMVTGDDLNLSAYERSQRFTIGAFSVVMTLVGARVSVKGLRTKINNNGGIMNTVKSAGPAIKNSLGNARSVIKSIPDKVHKPTWGGLKSGIGKSHSEISTAAQSIKTWFKPKSKSAKSGKPGSPKNEPGDVINNTPENKPKTEVDNLKPNEEPKSKSQENIKSDPEIVKKESGEQYTQLAEEAYSIYSKELPDALKILEDLIGEFGEITGRAKRPESAANRLQRANERFNKKIKTVDDAIENTWDALGSRIVLKDASPEAINGMVSHLCDGIKSGKIQVEMVNSLSGKNGTPYLTELHLQQLKQAGASVNQGITTSMREYDTGYTIGAIYVKYKSGVRGEIQIIGKEALKIANAEHLPYDAILNKPYLDAFKPEFNTDAKALIEPIRKAAQSLDETKRAVYNTYLNECYKSARNVESGGTSSSVPLPDGIPVELSIENLLRVEEATKKFKK